MNIVVCIKQVPATTNVQIDQKTGTLIREGVESVVNPFDEYAIEEAVRLKEKFGGTVTVLTMGPPQAESALREAISRGADKSLLVCDRAFAGADTLATSYTVACGIKKIKEYDLIICGKQATDGDTAQVGPGVAEKLDIPHCAYVRKIRDIKDGKIIIERMMEDGTDVIELPLPALITVVKEINTPRIPSLKGKMAAKKTEIIKWGPKDIDADPNKTGLNGSPTFVKKTFTPPPRTGGEKLTGKPEELAEKLVKKLKETKII